MKLKSSIKPWLKFTIKIILTIAPLLLLVLWASNKYVVENSKPYIYSLYKDTPPKKVGLVLGTAKTLGNGRVNLFFKYRIEAAAQLYRLNKIRYLIISGDHSEKYYNEPEDMKQALINAGIPDSVIFLDYAGLRTLDSVLRCRDIFGQDDFIIISQLFHNERAVFIAQKYGIKAIAFNAQTPSIKFGIKTYIREYFARVKVLLDVWTNKQPKYLGSKIHLPD